MSSRPPSQPPHRYLTPSHPPTPNPSTHPNLQPSGGPFHPLEYYTTNSNTNAPPLANEPSGLYSVLMTDHDLTLTKKKYVKVTGASEISIEPDRVNFVIQIKSLKPDIRDARASVRKREDYIINVLKKHFISESNYKIAEFVEKIQKPLVEDDNDDDENENNEYYNNEPKPNVLQDVPSKAKIPIQQFDIFKLTKEINVNVDNLMKYLQVFSICNEKLDQQVLISQPIIQISSNLMQASTQKAIRQAMINSQAKASELVGNYKHHHDCPGTRLALGALIYSQEDSLDVQKMTEYENTSSYFETFKWKRFNKRITCQITSVFEIVHARGKKYV